MFVRSFACVLLVISIFTMNNNVCKKCHSDSVVYVEYSAEHPEYYDGISEINCLKCGARFGRWSGKELATGESEKKCGR